MRHFYYSGVLAVYFFFAFTTLLVPSGLFARAYVPAQVFVISPEFEGGKVVLKFDAAFAQPRCEQDSILIYDGPSADAQLLAVWNCKRNSPAQASFFNESGALTVAVFSSDAQKGNRLAEAVQATTVPRAKIRNLNPYDACYGCRDTLAFDHALAPETATQWLVSADGRTGWRRIADAEGARFAPPQLRETRFYRAELLAPTAEEIVLSNVVKVSARVKDPKAERLRPQSTGCGNCPGSIFANAVDQTICEGECAKLAARAVLVTTIEDDFNAGINANLWNATTGATNQNCPGPNNDPVLWFGSDIARFAETEFLDVEGACSIAFQFKFGTEDRGTQPQGCDDAEDPQENVFFQYSTDGSTWTTLLTLDNGGVHDPLNPGPYDDWETICFDIPDVSSVKFRWIQNNFTGLGRDHWGLEDVKIDFQADPTYSWQGPGIIDGQNADTATVCPVANATYTVTASAAGQSLQETVQVEVVPLAALGGEAVGARQVCPLDTSGVLRVINYQGNVTTWQRSPGCDGTWTSVPNSGSQTFVDPAPVAETTCYRAVTQAGNCQGVSDSVKIEVKTFDPGEVTALQDTICPGEEASFLLSNYSGEIVGWGDSSGFAPGNTTPTFATNNTSPSRYCTVAWVKAPGCPDSTALPSTEACVQVRILPVPGLIVSEQFWTKCNTDSIFDLNLIGYVPEDVSHWEVSLDSGRTWIRLQNDPFVSPDSIAYNSDTAIAAGVGYRVILNPLQEEVCGIKKTPPPPYFIEQSECTCELFGVRECEGFGGAIAAFDTVGGLGCDTLVVLKWETALMPPDGNCDRSFLNWTETPNTGLSSYALVPPNPLTDSLCARAILDQGAAGLDTTRHVMAVLERLIPGTQPGQTGYVSVNPPLNCGGANAGQVSVFIQPGVKVGVNLWEYADASDPNNYISSQNQAIFFPFQNLREDRYFRITLIDTTNAPNCKATVFDTVHVVPVSAAGRVADSAQYCLGDVPAFISAADYQGTIVRWEYCEDHCDCGQGANPNWTPVPGTAGLDNFPLPSFALLDQNSPNAWCFRTIVSANATCPETPSQTALIEYLEPPVGGRADSSMFVCQGDPDGPMLYARGYVGQVVGWEFTSDCAAGPWTFLTNTAVDSFQTPPLAITTCFRAVISNGSCTAESTPATIDVLKQTVPGAVTRLGPDSLCSGGTSRFRLAESTGFQRWDLSEDGGATWAPIPASFYDGDSLTDTPPLTTSSCIRAALQSGVCPEVYSDTLCIHVDSLTEGGIIEAENNPVCAGTPPGLLELKNYRGEIEQWEAAPGCDGNWTVVPLAGPNFTPGPITQNTCFRALARNGLCPEAYSAILEITVADPPVGGALSPAATICPGDPLAPLELTGSRGTVLRWESASDPAGPWTDVGGAGQTQYQPGFLTESTLFRAILGSANCPEAISDTVEIVVQSQTQAGHLSGQTAFCSGEDPGAITLAGNTGPVLRWERSAEADCAGGWTPLSQTGQSYAPGPVSDTTCVRAVIAGGVCPEIFTQALRLDPSDAPVGGKLHGGKTICAVSTTTLLELIGHSGATLQWQVSTDGENYQPAPGASGTTHDPGQISQDTWFRVVVGNDQCPDAISEPAEIRLATETEPGIVQTGAVCKGDSATVELIGANGEVLRWQTAPAPNGPWTDAPETALVFTTPPLLADTWTRAEVRADGCAALFSPEARITVEDSSAGGTVSGATASCGAINGVELVLENFTGQPAGWEFSTDSLNWSPLPVENDTLQTGDLGETTWFRAQVKNGPCPAAASDPAKVMLHAASDGGELTGDTVICRGFVSNDIELINHDGEVLYWEASRDGGATWQNQGKAGFTTFNSGRLTVTTQFRAVVKNGPCPADTSTVAVVEVQSNNYAGPNGFLLSPGVVCPGRQAFLVAYNYIGTIDRWEYSTDGFQTYQTIHQNTRFLLTPPITEPTSFRAVVERACGETRTVVAQVFPRTPPTVDFASNVKCDGLGFILIRTNAAPPAQFHLSPAWGKQVNNLFLDLPPGRYDATVTDRYGCSASKTINLKPAAPPAPVITDVLDIRESEARVLWNPVPGTDVRYTIRYRKRGSRTWQYIENLTTNGYLFRGLDKGTEYEFDVRAQCGPNGLPSEWSSVGPDWFRTDLIEQECHFNEFLPQPVPRNIYFNPVTPASFTVHWDYVYYAAGYVVSYGMTRQNPRVWPQVMTCNPDTFLNIQNLIPGMEYGVRVRVNCDNCTTANKGTDRKSDWSAIQTVRTTPGRLGATERSNVASKELTIYPNPNNGAFTARFSSDAPGEARLRLFDVTGKTVWSESFAAEVGDNTIRVKTSGLPGGVYLLELQNGDAGLRAKVVVE